MSETLNPNQSENLLEENVEQAEAITFIEPIETYEAQLPQNAHEVSTAHVHETEQSHERAVDYAHERSHDKGETSEHATTVEARLRFAQEANEDTQPLPPPSQQVRTQQLNTNLQIVRRKLGNTEKHFSSFIHRPAIDAVSEFLARTFIRPTAFLSGAIFTFVGSLYYVYLTDHIRYPYNFFVALLLFRICDHV